MLHIHVCLTVVLQARLWLVYRQLLLGARKGDYSMREIKAEAEASCCRGVLT